MRESGLRAGPGHGGLRVLTTGDPGQVAPVVERLWGEAVAIDAVRI